MTLAEVRTATVTLRLRAKALLMLGMRRAMVVLKATRPRGDCALLLWSTRWAIWDDSGCEWEHTGDALCGRVVC